MPSDTKNVKLGVCRVFFGGVDLGYTQGGVEVSVSTETHKVEVDQFGKTPINELIMGRQVSVKVPLAETTLDNMVAIMPGAQLVTDGVKASGYVTVATNPTDSETCIINGVTLTFKTAPTADTHIKLGATKEDTAQYLADLLQNSTNAALVGANYAVNASTKSRVDVTYDTVGTAGNAFTLATGTAAAKFTVSGATLTGGTAVTKAYVKVPTGIGVDLLSIAKELRLHPKGKSDYDRSDDFVIPLAATPGAMTFAYKLEQERVFNTEFSAYPDPTTDQLFYVGDAIPDLA